MLFLTGFLLLIFIAYPIWDYFHMKQLKNNPRPKLNMYREIIIPQWIIVFICFLFFFVTDRSLVSLFVLEQSLAPSVPATLPFVIALSMTLVIIIQIFVIHFSPKAKNKFLTNFPKEFSFLKRVQGDSPTVGGR